MPSHTITAAGLHNNTLSTSTETPVPCPIPTAPCSVRPLCICHPGMRPPLPHTCGAVIAHAIIILYLPDMVSVTIDTID